jgi:signal transduction histidine kinase/CheY-like chemotaxis protein
MPIDREQARTTVPREKQLMLSRRFSRILIFVGLTLVYFLAGKLGLRLAFINASASPVWPPSGIALGAILVLGYWTWPAVFAAAFLVNLTTAGSVATSAAIGLGNTVEAVFGAWLVNRFAGGTRVFERPQDVFKFAFAALTSTLISPSIGLTSLALGGFADWSRYWAIWSTWWLGDGTGDLIFAPVVILWGINRRHRWSARNDTEVALLLLLLVALAEVVFGGWLPISARNYPVTFICGPVVIWLAFRMSQRETATAIFILSGIAVWGTLHNFGPFVLETENQSLIILQMWMAALTLTAMALAAGMAERGRAHAALEAQKVMVEAANHTKDNFLAMLSHELRTPLSPVLLAVETLQQECSRSVEARSALDIIRRNMAVEKRLIDDLLDINRIAKGKLELKLTSIDAHAQILDVVETCRSESAAKSVKVELRLQAKDHYVAVDEARFQQIMWNLLKNAIKFSPEEGQITIFSANESRDNLTISLQDQGIGIDAETIERIFNPFEQGERSFKRRFGGLGLGLAISKSLAEAHGAALTVRSEGLNRGATFCLRMKTAAPPEDGRTPQIQPRKSSPSKLRILLVDDHVDTCTVMKKILAGRGHDVTVAQDIRSALEQARMNNFDLLISDVGLPDGSGMELLAQLKSNSEVAAIAMSGFGTDVDIERSLKAGFSQHLIKPVTLENLTAAVDSAILTKHASRGSIR